MPFKRSVMRFAHTNGYTNCCYTDTGDRIITSGADGDIRIWNGIDDDDPTSQCIGEFVLCAIHYDQRLVASTDINTVQGYTFPDGDRDGIDFRFTAPATCIRVNKKFIAAGSEDTTILVAPLGTPAEAFELTGHEGPLLKIDLSVNDLLVSSSGDGTIRIWNVNQKKEVKCITGFHTVNTFFSATKFICPVFEPTKGKSIAYAKDQEIIIINSENFEVNTTLKNEKISSDYSCCSYSPCGRYIAAGTVSGEISIWNCNSGEVIKGDIKGIDCLGITSIEWNPSNNNELAYVDNTGQLGIVVDCCGQDENEDIIDNQSEVDVDFGDVEFTNGKDDDEDEDNENCVSLEKLKNETIKMNTNDEIDDILDDLSEKASHSNAIVAYKPIPLQPPFQPGATPKNLEHRYMVWNSIGIVRAHTSDTGDSIEVEFHDASVHHGLHMANYHHHTLASLSTKVLALSCETPCKLVCIALAAGTREWSISLPDCEEILALAASEKLVAAATDARNLRLFSIMGTQREIISLPGPIVAVSGHNDTIIAAYHSAPATEDDQHISMMIIQAIGLCLKCRDVKIPLTPGSKLKWIGFSDRCSPVIYDSYGMIRMMNLKSNYWLPICDTKIHIKNESDNYFIINISEENQIVQAILCRGSLYPLTTPRPMVFELPLQIPMCALEAEKTLLEETLIRNANFSSNNSESQMKETGIKLFALACRSEMEARAKELIEMIASPILLPLAIKYATKLGRIHLSEKLEELLPQLEEQEREREKKSNDIEMEAINLLQNSPMSATLLLKQKEQTTTPVIAPKPMISSQKRNPFKRSIGGTPKPINNPLSHLTDKVIGYNESQESVDMFPLTHESTGITTSKLATLNDLANNETENNENIVSNENTAPATTQKPFMVWFGECKDELSKEFPDCTIGELIKHGMRKYREIGNSDKVVNKRKIIDDDSTKSSGIAKLAKFGFNNVTK